jgi:hypothetical protein
MVGGDFSHAYIFEHQYFGSKQDLYRKYLNKFIYQHVFSHNKFWHMCPILGVTKSKPNGYQKKNQITQKK